MEEELKEKSLIKCGVGSVELFPSFCKYSVTSFIYELDCWIKDLSFIFPLSTFLNLAFS